MEFTVKILIFSKKINSVLERAHRKHSHTHTHSHSPHWTARVLARFESLEARRLQRLSQRLAALFSTTHGVPCCGICAENQEAGEEKGDEVTL